MATKKKPTVEVETVEQKMAAEAICPKCLEPVDGHMCRFCGATKAINDVSGNVIWMLNGRVVAAFRDERAAYVQMAERSGIPRGTWPERFRN
jgi:hypothetical protein